jgi:hypothetical protein
VFGGTVGGVLEGFWVRVIASGLYGHVLYTGLAGLGIAWFVTRRGTRPLGQRLLVALGLLSLAMFAHFLWNSPFIWDALPLPAAAAAKGLPFLFVLVILLRLARRREHRWLAAALETEVGRQGLIREELEMLIDPGRRKQARGEVRSMAGAGAEQQLKRLQHEQLGLAMVATRAQGENDPDLLTQRRRCQDLRTQLWALHRVIDALGLQPATVEATRNMPPVQVPARSQASSVNAPTGPVNQHVVPLASSGGDPGWVVGPSGAAARATPDPAADPVTTLAPGLAVTVVQRAGGWVQVRAANGWTGWVDARLVVQLRPSYWQ